jgi:ABC-type lipoprotein release transport system permease subunit
MNPLSPLIYHHRHKWSALVLITLITLATMGLFIMVAILDSITLTRTHISYLTRVSQVYPNVERSFEPGIVSKIQTHPGVARVIPENGLSISLPGLGASDSLNLLGASQDDVQYLIDHFGLRLKEGRLLEPRTNEMMLSEEVARALDLRLGDQIDRSVDTEYYWEIMTPLVLVGILEGDPSAMDASLLAGPEPSVRVGFASHEYLDSHELYAPRIVSQIVVAREGRKAAVDEFLETTIASPRTEVRTYGTLYRLVAADRRELFIGIGIVNCLVAIAAAVVVGVINHIAMTQRLSELGLLNALGHHRNRLIRRLAVETATVAGIGWFAGLVLALLVLAWLKANVYYARGLELDLTNLTPLWFVVPIPLTVVALATLGISRMFAKFDAVAILERGRLGLEARLKGRWRAVKNSSVRPLSSLTFYLRHRRRGIVLVTGTALTILVITLPIFITSAITDARKPNFEHLRYVGEVWSGEGRTVDAGVMAHIKSHPAVERVIPAISLELQIAVPLGGAATTNVYGVSENDLPALMTLFGMHVGEGRLPRARSNEIVLPESVAMNHGLRVGDTINLPFHILGQADQMIVYNAPIEMSVVGILGQTALRLRPPSLGRRTKGSEQAGQARPSDDLWLGFASYEYLASHESTSSRPVRLLVVPTEGRKTELDAWLEESVDSVQTNVATYNMQYHELQQTMRETALIFVVTEIGIAIIAAIAVATMNYVFFSQRRQEYGVLHAVGHSRLWLILRTVRETGSVVAVAWLISALVYGIGMICAQLIVYAPKGLSLNLFNPIPWLFTLPIPLAVVIASAGTISHMLSKFDPVTVIEKR